MEIIHSTYQFTCIRWQFYSFKTMALMFVHHGTVNKILLMEIIYFNNSQYVTVYTCQVEVSFF